jgi:hypothetical protein
MDKIHKMPYFGHLDYQKTTITTRKQYFGLGTKRDVVN